MLSTLIIITHHIIISFYLLLRFIDNNVDKKISSVKYDLVIEFVSVISNWSHIHKTNLLSVEEVSTITFIETFSLVYRNLSEKFSLETYRNLLLEI